MRSTLVLSVVLLLVGRAFARADDTEQDNEIRQLLSTGKLDEAEKAFQAAVEANPDSPRFRTLNNHFYFYLNRAGRTHDAARYAEADVDSTLGRLLTVPQLGTTLVRQVDNVTSAYTRIDQRDVAIQKLDKVIKKVDALLAEKKSAEISGVVFELRAKKSLLLAGAGKVDEGRALLDSIRKEAETSFTANVDDAVAALALANVLAIRAQFEFGGEAAETASKEHLDFLSAQAKAHPSSVPLVSTYYNTHLREWRDKYSDKGLVIIGATRYYGYEWDDATDHIKKVEGLSAEDERAAMVRFAQHHELKHQFMVMPKESEFSKKYGVTGIPQAVLIGRDGKVQMIRVGSGEANAHDLEAKIEELLAASN